METTRSMARRSTWAILLFFVVGAAEASLKLPSFIKPCSRNDPKFNECVLASAIPAIPKLTKGLPEYGVVTMDPLFIKRMSVDKNLFGLGMEFMDVELKGLSQSKIKSIRIKLDPLHFTWSIFVPKLTYNGKYEADGRILLLPISGKGNFNVTVVGVSFTYSLKGELVKKDDGEEYLSTNSYDVQYKVQKVQLNLGNLFNGNKLLGDIMNSFLNENWKEVETICGQVFMEKIATSARSAIEGLTSHVPYNQFFIN